MGKYFKLSTFLITIIPFGLIFAGNSGKIAGIVIDMETKAPLPGANVIIDGTMMGSASDIDGNYFILDVPPEVYTVRAEVIGYKTLIQKEVRVMVGLTTKLHFDLEQTVIEVEEVIVEAERPIIQKDLTASRSIITADEIADIPLEDIEDIVNLTPGFVDGHARGGRDGEIVYIIDGVSTRDPITGGFDTDVPELAIEEVSIITSGFS